MYAIIETGGQQFKVSEDNRILINKIAGEKGDKIEFDKVLLLKDKEVNLGNPYIEQAKVFGVIKAQKKGKKILVGKHRRRKDFQKINGFRPEYTEVTISAIQR